MRLPFFLFGLLVGAAALGIPAFLSGPGDRPPGLSAARTDANGDVVPGESDLDRLLEENARLRADLERLRNRPGRAEVSTEEATTPTDEEVTPVEAVDTTSDPQLIADTNHALQVLLAEMTEQITFGLLRERFKEDATELATFVMQTWMANGQPERALQLLQTLRLPGFTSDTAHWIAQALKEKGNRTLARDALLIGLRINPTDWSVIQMLAEIDPDAALEAQARHLANAGEVGDEVPMQKALLLLAAHRRDDALKLIDQMIADGKMADYVWDQLVEREPAAAAERLRVQLAAQPEDDEVQLRLVTALRNAGDATAARAQIDAMLARSPDNAAAMTALGELDRRAALTVLEARIGTAPTGQTYYLYGQQLAAAGRTEDAITAYWQAWQLQPGNGYQYQLLQLAPERYATQMAEVARRNNDDEALGDIADALWQRGRHDEALVLWEEALRLDPGDGEWVNKVRQVRAGHDPFN